MESHLSVQGETGNAEQSSAAQKICFETLPYEIRNRIFEELLDVHYQSLDGDEYRATAFGLANISFGTLRQVLDINHRVHYKCIKRLRKARKAKKSSDSVVAKRAADEANKICDGFWAGGFTQVDNDLRKMRDMKDRADHRRFDEERIKTLERRTGDLERDNKKFESHARELGIDNKKLENRARDLEQDNKQFKDRAKELDINKNELENHVTKLKTEYKKFVDCVEDLETNYKEMKSLEDHAKKVEIKKLENHARHLACEKARLDSANLVLKRVLAVTMILLILMVGVRIH